MTARAIFALAALVSSMSVAAAQRQIPPNEMPGRERERFIESPAERFMKPGPYVVPDVVKKAPRSKHRPKRPQRGKDR